MKEQLSSIRLCTSAGRRVPIVSNSTSPLGLARGASGGRARQRPALLRIRSAHDGQSGRHPTGNSSHVDSGGLTTPTCWNFQAIGSQNGLEGTFKDLLIRNEQGLLPLDRVPQSPIQPDIKCLLPSNGASTTPLCQGLTTLIAQIFFLYLSDSPLFQFKTIPSRSVLSRCFSSSAPAPCTCRWLANHGESCWCLTKSSASF